MASIAVDTAVLHPIDDRANVVHVMSVYEARQWDVASLFVCGMTDRDFPRQHPQNLLFPDSDIERLRSAGIPVRKAADYEREERWLFDSLRTRASDSLFLSYPRARCVRQIRAAFPSSVGFRSASRTCAALPTGPAGCSC